jgi:hypothetical protein
MIIHWLQVISVANGENNKSGIFNAYLFGKGENYKYMTLYKLHTWSKGAGIA